MSKSRGLLKTGSEEADDVVSNKAEAQDSHGVYVKVDSKHDQTTKSEHQGCDQNGQHQEAASAIYRKRFRPGNTVCGPEVCKVLYDTDK